MVYGTTNKALSSSKIKKPEGAPIEQFFESNSLLIAYLKAQSPPISLEDIVYVSDNTEALQQAKEIGFLTIALPPRESKQLYGLLHNPFPQRNRPYQPLQLSISSIQKPEAVRLLKSRFYFLRNKLPSLSKIISPSKSFLKILVPIEAKRFKTSCVGCP